MTLSPVCFLSCCETIQTGTVAGTVNALINLGVAFNRGYYQKNP